MTDRIPPQSTPHTVQQKPADGRSRVLITGGTGFIGPSLVQALQRRGYQCLVFSRQPRGGKGHVPGAEYVQALTDAPDPLPPLVINLAGEGIADKRWTRRRRQQLLDSRVGVTRALVALYRQRGQVPERVISGSAVGYYGNHPSPDTLDEDGRCMPGFSHDLCHEWEKAALEFENLGSAVCRLRLGVVLGDDGGLVARLRLPFSLGLGGVIGSGEQWMSWIHRDDLVRLLIYTLEHNTLQGAINATAPQPVTNAEFTACFARQLSRPTLLPMPAFVVRLLFGEMGEELLLGGQRVLPSRAVRSGFEFRYPELDTALAEVFGANHQADT